MKVSTQQRRWILGVALALTLAATLSVGSQDEDVAAVSQPAPRQSRNSTREEAPATDGKIQLARMNRQHLPEQAQDLFAGRSWYVAPPAPSAIAPSAPPMPYVYAGKVTEDGAQPVVVLSKQGRSYVVRQGDILESIYRVDEIRAPLMSLTYLPLNVTQTIQMGESN